MSMQEALTLCRAVILELALVIFLLSHTATPDMLSERSMKGGMGGGLFTVAPQNVANAKFYYDIASSLSASGEVWFECGYGDLSKCSIYSVWMWGA